MEKLDVLAIGELNVDMIVTGMKCMPVIGREIIAENFSITLGSSTAICACGISKLGLKTAFAGKLGKDSFGEVVLEGLGQYGINLEHVIIDKNINTGVTISLSTDKDRALVTYLGSIDALTVEDIDLDLLKNVRHIHIGSYFLQSNLRPGIQKLFNMARKTGVTTSLDAGWDDTQNWDYGILEVLKNTDVFFPNEVEALSITKKETVEEALETLSNYCRTVVVKCGSKGAVAKSGNTIIEKASYDVKVVDTTGAGDSFNAGFIYGFLNGLSLDKCMEYGNACGAVSVTRVGGASSCASLKEIESIVAEDKI